MTWKHWNNAQPPHEQRFSLHIKFNKMLTDDEWFNLDLMLILASIFVKIRSIFKTMTAPNH